MKKQLLALLMCVSAGAVSAAPNYYKIDPSHTFPHFSIAHFNFSTLYGRFDQTSGHVMIDWENKNGFVDVKIAAVSVNTGYKKRDEHLKSPDFLNVMEHTDIHYESTNIEFKNKEQAIVQGKLTMLGVTRPVSLEVHHISCGVNPINSKDTCGFEARTTIKRSDFGSRYGLPGIGDEMKLWFEVEAIKEE